MEEILIKISPDEQETDILLDLDQWYNTLKKAKKCPQYVLDRISCDIQLSWENPDIRKETIGIAPYQLEIIKKSLIQKYKEDGDISQQLVNKVESLKDSLNPTIYKHYLSNAVHLISYTIHTCMKVEYISAMMDSGLLPRRESFLKINIQKEIDEFGDRILSVNNNYILLKEWSEKLLEGDSISNIQKEELKKYSLLDFVISTLESSLLDKNPLEKAQYKILESLSEEEIERHSSFLSDLDIFNDDVEGEKTKLYPNQERFYASLEKWASEIKNPWCSKWITEYLKTGRHLPFYRIKVLRFHGNMEKAKAFLLDKYEQLIIRRYRKNKEYEEKRRRRQKRYDKHYKKIVRNLREKYKDDLGSWGRFS